MTSTLLSARRKYGVYLILALWIPLFWIAAPTAFEFLTNILKSVKSGDYLRHAFDFKISHGGVNGVHSLLKIFGFSAFSFSVVFTYAYFVFGVGERRKLSERLAFAIPLGSLLLFIIFIFTLPALLRCLGYIGTLGFTFMRMCAIITAVFLLCSQIWVFYVYTRKNATFMKAFDAIFSVLAAYIALFAALYYLHESGAVLGLIGIIIMSAWLYAALRITAGLSGEDGADQRAK